MLMSVMINIVSLSILLLAEIQGIPQKIIFFTESIGNHLLVMIFKSSTKLKGSKKCKQTSDCLWLPAMVDQNTGEGGKAKYCKNWFKSV